MSILTEQTWIYFFITVSLAVVFCEWKQKRVWKFFLISFLTYYILTFCNVVLNLSDGIIGITDNIFYSSMLAVTVSLSSLIFFYLFRSYQKQANSFIDDPHKSPSLKHYHPITLKSEKTNIDFQRVMNLNFERYFRLIHSKINTFSFSYGMLVIL